MEKEVENLKARIRNIKRNKTTENSNEYWNTLIEFWEDKAKKMEAEIETTSPVFIKFDKKDKIDYCNKMIASIKKEQEKIK